MWPFAFAHAVITPLAAGTGSLWVANATPPAVASVAVTIAAGLVMLDCMLAPLEVVVCMEYRQREPFARIHSDLLHSWHRVVAIGR